MAGIKSLLLENVDVLMHLCIEYPIMTKTKKTGYAKSRADIQRAYCQRLKEKDLEAVLGKERQRWHTRRQQKKVKVIADRTEREQRSIRKKWQSSKAEYRKLQKTRENDTPPVSGLSSPTEKRRGRPRVPYRFRKHTRRLIN